MGFLYLLTELTAVVVQGTAPASTRVRFTSFLVADILGITPPPASRDPVTSSDLHQQQPQPRPGPGAKSDDFSVRRLIHCSSDHGDNGRSKLYTAQLLCFSPIGLPQSVRLSVSLSQLP